MNSIAMHSSRFAVAATLLAVLPACFSPDLPGRITCGDHGDCPPGLRCEASVNVCVPEGQNPVFELRFDSQPATFEALVTAPAVTLRLVDAAGELVPVSGGVFTAELDANPAGVELREPVSATAEHGIVAFDGLSFQRPGRGLHLTVRGGANLIATGSAFDVTATRPAVTGISLRSNIDGCAIVDYKLAQAQSQPVDVLVEVDPDGPTGPEGFRRATQARSEPGKAGVLGVGSSPDARKQEFSWNTSADLPRLDDDAELRITPSVRGIVGTPLVAKVKIENGPRFVHIEQEHPDYRIMLEGDANNDGLPSDVAVRAGAGHIELDSGQVPIPDNLPVIDLALADLNGDGLPDLAMALSTRTAIAFQQRTSTPAGRWAPALDLAGLPPLAQVLAVDMDHDGIDELIGVEQASGAVVVLRARSGSTEPWVELARPWTAGRTGRVLVADLDHDGWPDLVIGRSVADDPVAIVRGTALGFAAPETDSALTGNVLAVGDLDHDGRDDVASLDAEGLHVVTATDQVDVPGITGNLLVIHDIDDDARNDLIVAKQASILVYPHVLDRGQVAFQSGQLAGQVPSVRSLIVTRSWVGARASVLALTDVNPWSVFLGNETPRPCGARLSGAISSSVPLMKAGAVGGDLNGDGKPDAFGSINQGNGLPWAASMALGNGDGTFSHEAVEILEYPAANHMKNAQLVDLDRDGVVDVAFLETPRDEVSYLYNDPAHPGQFTRVDLATGIGPVALAVADLDHDDVEDLVLMGSNQIQVRHGDPSGTRRFGDPIVVATLADMNMDAGQCAGLCGLKLTDLDADGELDILAYSEVAQFGIRADRAAPHGFAAPIAFGVAHGTILAVANFMGDARREVLFGVSTSPEGEGWLQAYSFNADASAFEPVWQYPTLAKHVGLSGAVVDLDRDGMDEIVVPFDGLAVIGGKPEPGLRRFTAPAFHWPELYDVSSMDVDGDGAPELIASGGPYAFVIDLAADGQPELGRLLSTRGASQAYDQELVTGDFSGDGLLDLAVGDAQAQTVWLTRQSSAAVGTLAPDELAIPGAQFVALQDLDRDGRADAITPGAAQLAMMGLDGQATELRCPAESDLWPLSVADLNRDGRPDLITSGATQVQMFDAPAYGCSPPITVMSLERPGAPTHHPCVVKSVDMNHDGLLDVVVVSDAVRVALQRPEVPGTFDVTDYEYVSDPPYRSYIDAVIADLDDDLVMDVVVLGEHGALRVFYGDSVAPGHLLASQPIDDPSWHGPGALSPVSYSLALGDVNDDRRMDIVTSSGTRIYVFHQGPTARKFELAYALSGAHDDSYRGGQISLVDFDADGRLDLLFADPEQGTMLLRGR